MSLFESGMRYNKLVSQSKEQLRHRTVSLRQHGILVLIFIRRAYADISLRGVIEVC